MTTFDQLTIKSTIEGYKKKKFNCEEITNYFVKNI